MPGRLWLNEDGRGLMFVGNVSWVQEQVTWLFSLLVCVCLCVCYTSVHLFVRVCMYELNHFPPSTLLVFWFISHVCYIYYFVCIKLFIIKWGGVEITRLFWKTPGHFASSPSHIFQHFSVSWIKDRMARVHALKLQFKNKYLSSVKHWTKDLISSILSDDQKNKLVFGLVLLWSPCHTWGNKA